ncbi:hypothetical protein GY45DRAFT_947777 [Cubamyces sp. BRFM 1775]|nr:hypothetical protein GY45DRAFT_947777 [Cubamyces sp. BRFM 1775]
MQAGERTQQFRKTRLDAACATWHGGHDNHAILVLLVLLYVVEVVGIFGAYHSNWALVSGAYIDAFLQTHDL